MKRELPKYPGRTRFGGIACEYMAPLTKSRKVIVLCSGMPGYPGGNGRAIRTLAERGYWVFVPRYAGSWESAGMFLAHEPTDDVLAVVHGVGRGFMDAWSQKVLKVANPQVYVIGASFGGAAAILSTRDALVNKVVALSPVIDWRAQDKTTEPVDIMARFVHEAFGSAYRGKVSVWRKLASGKFYNPEHKKKGVAGKKLMIIHAKDDEVVPFAPAKRFAEEVGAQFSGLPRGGHFGASSALKPHLWRRIEAFLG